MATMSTAKAVSASVAAVATGASLPVLAPARAARARVLSPAAAFVLQVSILVSFFASSSAPSPLYPVYQAQWGFSPITVTVVFGVYAIAVLAALLVFGRLSDWVGRRPVLIVTTALQAATMLLFAAAGGLSALVEARIIQGLATGAAAGALGAGLLDLDRQKGTIANAVAPMLGTATGGIVSGLMIAYLPAPTHLVYLVLFVVMALQAVGVVLMPESSPARPGALASLRPRLRVAPAARRPLLRAAPALVASWALAGFYLSLGPTLVRRIVGATSLPVGGLAILAMAGSGGLAVLLLRARAARVLMTFGTSALIAGVATTLFAVTRGSAPAFFVGTALSGAGFGTAFQGAMRTVLPLAAAHERAGMLSVLYIVSYLAFGLPAVLGGVGVVYGAGLAATAQQYGVAVMILAALALAGTAGGTRNATTG